MSALAMSQGVWSGHLDPDPERNLGPDFWWFEGRYVHQITDTNISQPLVWLITLSVKCLYISVSLPHRGVVRISV